MDPDKTAVFLSLKLTLYTEDLVPPGGKFKNLNLVSYFYLRLSRSTSAPCLIFLLFLIPVNELTFC